MRYPADPVVSAIEAGQVLPIKEVHKGSGWVSDELKGVVSQWDCNKPGLKPPVIISMHQLDGVKIRLSKTF